MIRKLLGLLWTAIFSMSAQAAGTGDWNLYLSYHKAVHNVPVGDEIFVNYDGNLLAYRPGNGEVKQYSKMDGMNGRFVQFMGYSDTEKCLVLVYRDSQIDLLYPADGHIESLPQIKDSGLDQITVNNLFVSGDEAILSMGNGIAHLNLKRGEVTGYYVLDQQIQAAALYRDRLYAAGENGLWGCDVHGNPLDKGEWQFQQQASFSDFAVNGNALYGTVDRNAGEGALAPGLWLMENPDAGWRQASATVFTHVFAQKGKMVVSNASQVLVFDAARPFEPEVQLHSRNAWNGLTRSSDGLFWANAGEAGLQAYQVSGDSLRAKGEAVGGYGPIRDLCYYMKYYGRRLMIGGGRLDPFDREYFPGTVMELTDGRWHFFQEKGIPEATGGSYLNVTSVVVDPQDEKRVIASTGRMGLYEFRDYRFAKHVSLQNSPLQSAAAGSPFYVRVDGLNYDRKGNLWMVNNTQQDTILRAVRPDGTWKSFYIEPLKGAPTCEKTLIDQKGRLWVASRRTVDRHIGGLLCLDYNETLDNTKDDVFTYRTSFLNQDGKSYTLEGVYCMAEEDNGSIWVGTKVGLFVVSNPDDWHKSDFRVTQIKVPRNDGTNLADYLLSDIAVTALAIDGAGRKWIGTESNGLYLVSPDGLQILEHFEEDNSPLLSNTVYAIAPNLETGEIMIGTDKGLCAYQSAATQPTPSLDKSKMKVYPNPVRPEYRGTVRVTGLTGNAEVKVVTTSGEVVAAGRSTGGTFVWDVRSGDGSRVAPGVYYLMVATADGKKGEAVKIVVI